MSDGYQVLAQAIIAQATEDVRIYKPLSQEFETADKFFQTSWFYELANFSETSPDTIRRTVRDIKKKRSSKWYKLLTPTERNEQNSRMAEHFIGTRTAQDDMIIWAWQTLDEKLAQFGTA